MGGFERITIEKHPQNPNAFQGFRSPTRWEDGQSGILQQHWIGSYYGFLSDGHGFVRLPQTKWFATGGSWRLSVDGRPFETEVEWSDLPHDTSGRCLFDLAFKMSIQANQEIPECHWDEVSSTLVIRQADGSRFFLRFRTPSDTLKFGTDLSELRWHSATGDTSVVYTRFELTDAAFDKTIDLKSHDVIQTQLGKEFAERSGSEEFSYSQMQSVGLPNSHRSDLLADTLGLAQTPTLKQNVTDYQTYYQSLDDRSQLRLLLEHPNKVFDLSSSSGIGQLYDSLSEKLEWIADERYRQRGDLLQIDDTSMRWRDAERITSAIEMWKIVEYSRQLTSESILSKQDRLRLLARIAELGPPSFNGTGETFKNREFEDPLIEAMFYTRWQWVTESKHHDALVHAIKTYAVGTPHSLLAIDSLIRLGQLDRVPSKEMDSWWASYILNAHNKSSRMRALSTISRHEAGLRYLIEKLRTQSNVAPLDQEIASVISSRAWAARKLGRYDIVSKELCTDIEKIRSSRSKLDTAP
ncbi:hypothetical protein C5Y96_11015 [Blastopirellula marina]|uniref:Uncharacterized protein n=2 Tax=Pirellulales TaxID=2691354 RepID=A0A2S8FME3_9BACT|nr:hypothetical protein C5Y96_11015 [Blastopirellula marina]RCS52461.1 hypothetical protein DTL36_11025 [Bremerella cremea]